MVHVYVCMCMFVCVYERAYESKYRMQTRTGVDRIECNTE